MMYYFNMCDCFNYLIKRYYTFVLFLFVLRENDEEVALGEVDDRVSEIVLFCVL